MESVNYGAMNYLETDLSDSIVLIDDLNESNGDKVDQLCDSGKIYHSCYTGHRDGQHEDDDDNDAGEAIAIAGERGTPDGKSDTDIDDEDITSSGQRDLVQVTYYNVKHSDSSGQGEEDEDEEEEEEEIETLEEREEDEDDDDDDEEEEEEEEEHIEVRTPQWTDNRIQRNSDTISADSSNSTSECESKSTSVSFVDDSLLLTISQQADSQVKTDSVGMTLTDYSDLEDKTDFSSFQELTNDDETIDEADEDGGENDDDQVNDKRSTPILGGPNDNKAFETIDNHQPIGHHHHHHRTKKGSKEETVGLLAGEIDNEDKMTGGCGGGGQDDEPLISINCKPLLFLENPLIATGLNDDEVSLITKHATYQRHGIKINGGTSTSCSASASSASTSTSTSSRTIARRMVKSSGKAVKSFSKKLTKLFK